MGRSVEAYLVYGIYLDEDWFYKNKIETEWDEENCFNAADRIITKYLTYLKKDNYLNSFNFSSSFNFEYDHSSYGNDEDALVFYVKNSKNLSSDGIPIKINLDILEQDKKDLNEFINFINKNYNSNFKPQWILFGYYG